MKTNPRVGTVTYSAEEMKEFQRFLEDNFKSASSANDTNSLLLIREMADMLGIYMSTMGA